MACTHGVRVRACVCVSVCLEAWILDSWHRVPPPKPECVQTLPELGSNKHDWWELKHAKCSSVPYAPLQVARKHHQQGPG